MEDAWALIRAEHGTTLFGLQSYWEGFDAPGPTLSFLQIEKAPYPPPDEGDLPDSLPALLLPDVPVLFLTAKDAVEDRIAGLTAGGDDYVTKPFSLEEVVARLRGLIRRSCASGRRSESVLAVGDLTLDEDSHEVTRGGDSIHLTATEFELLRYLMRNPRRVLSKAQILDRVWSYDFGGQANVVELYISYLRRKIDAGREPMIHTRRGAGYLIKPAVLAA